MNKRELGEKVAEALGESKAYGVRVVDAVLHEIHEAVAAGEKVSLAGHGIYEKVRREARTARNPQTGGSVEVPAADVPKFRAGTEFKAKVNTPAE